MKNWIRSIKLLTVGVSLGLGLGLVLTSLVYLFIPDSGLKGMIFGFLGAGAVTFSSHLYTDLKNEKR